MIASLLDPVIGAIPGADASSRVTLAVWGLVLLALIIAVVTVVFWRLTRPEPPSAGRTIRRPDEGDDAGAVAQ